MPELAVCVVFHCDHYRPVVDGGTTVASNLIWACPHCNHDKRQLTLAVDPRTRRYAPIFNPRIDRWEDHFGWSADRLEIRGRSATGRATVRLLHMNRSVARHIRYLLLLAGEHPADA